MPSKYVKRNFANKEIYHIYHCGVEEKSIFLDEKDYSLFLYYLSAYLLPVEKVLQIYRHLPPRLFSKNLSKDITLLSYSLLPTHFHLLIKQENEHGISKFMKQLTNAYTQYYNHLYKHKGSLFEGRYKAVHVPSEDILAVNRYIENTPRVLQISATLEYQWSSYNEYIEPSRFSLCNSKTILSLFPSIYAYKKYQNDSKGYNKSLEKIEPLLIDRH